MNMECEYIVFGSEHYNPLGIIRSIGEAGINPTAVIIRSDRPFASKSKYIKTLHLVDNLEEGYDLIQKKYNKHDSSNKSFVLTGGDDVTSYLDMHYDDLKDGFIFQNAGEKGRITHYMNKSVINALAIKHGFDVLEYKVVYKDSSLIDIGYPIITKSISSNAGGKSDVFICNNQRELKNVIENINSNPFLVQKYIKKKNELCLDGLSVNKGKDVVITMATNYRYLLDDSYSQYMNMFSYHNKEIKKKITDMLTEIRYEGIFTVEFLVDDKDNLFFLEINLRNSGWSYASTCVGMNMPMIWCKAMLQGKVPENVIKEIPEGSTAMADLDDFRIRVRRMKKNPIKWFREFRNCTAVFYYNEFDKKPLMVLLLSRVFKVFFSRHGGDVIHGN